MWIEQPPMLYRSLYPGSLWRIGEEHRKTIYLTFDDGPIPEVAPWVLELLDRNGIKATFFCVGDNVRKYPHLYRQLLEKGLKTGNHTFNHVEGWKSHTAFLLENTAKAAELIVSTVADLERGECTDTPQAPQGGCYTAMLNKAEGEIDWSENAKLIHGKVRAFYPLP